MAQCYPGIRQHVSSGQSPCCCKGVATPTSIFGNVARDHQDHRFPTHQEPPRPTLYCTVRPKECEGESAKAEHHGSGTDFCVGFPLQEDCMLYGEKKHHLFFLHRMVKERNRYNKQCQKAGREPLLPKAASRSH